MADQDHARAVEQYNSIIDQHLAENARLKAELERLKGIILAQSSDFVRSKTADDGIKPEGHNDLAGRAVERCLKLQAEVERLKEGNECLNQMHEKEMARSAYLCEQVERLRKAGDAMAKAIKWLPQSISDHHLDAWNAANARTVNLRGVPYLHATLKPLDQVNLEAGAADPKQRNFDFNQECEGMCGV